jgi:hypothetical protein
VGQTALVDRDVDEGARLIQEIDASGFPVTAAMWAHDPGLDIWRLIIAVPTEKLPSPRAAYDRIQSAILELDLNLPLDRITRISDDGPTVGNLRELIKAGSADVVEIPLGGSSIAGEPVDKGYGYRLEALRYEREVFAALQRNQPQGAVLRRAGRLDFPRNLDLDFVLDNGQTMVLVEAKALSRPLGSREVENLIDRKLEFFSSIHRPTVWLLVSKTGFTTDAVNLERNLETHYHTFVQVTLVTWVDRSGDPQLREGIYRAMGMQGFGGSHS